VIRKRSGGSFDLYHDARPANCWPAPTSSSTGFFPGRNMQTGPELGNSQIATPGRREFICPWLYYNHSCNSKQTAEWEKAVGYHDRDKTRLAQRYSHSISVGWMGERYKGWVSERGCWFPQAATPWTAVVRSIPLLRDMSGFSVPLGNDSRRAAKRGYAGRLVTYNAGVDETFPVHDTPGLLGRGNKRSEAPGNRPLPRRTGLQWFGWTCLNAREWVHTKPNTGAYRPPTTRMTSYWAYAGSANSASGSDDVKPGHPLPRTGPSNRLESSSYVESVLSSVADE